MSSALQNSINTDLDQSDMHGAITAFPDQLRESFKIMESWTPLKEYSGIQKIMILGMGGSAIGGDLAKVIAQYHCLVPIIVNRSYTIPQWVDSNTLIFASSYSGDTEETLSTFSQCQERNCPILVFSTGGVLSQHAIDMDLDWISIPKGFQPRAALGFSFTLMLLVLEYLGLIPPKVVEEIKNSITPLENLSSQLSQMENSSLTIAKDIYATCPIIYGSEEMSWVAALRFRCQLAENAKMLSFHHNIPEQNHNEIEGWNRNANIMRQFSLIWLRDIDDYHRTQTRMDISSCLLESIPKCQLTISQSGANRVERLLKLIHYTDWISYYAALLNKVDPTPVNRIQELKKRIALNA